MSATLSIIDPKAKIGQGVEIGPFTTIAGDVEIGDGTWIGPNVTIMDGARIGRNCRIFPGAVISAIPQDLKFEGEQTTVEIGDNTTIRECCTINRGTKDRFKTTIGSNCLLMAYVHVAHDAAVGNNCIIANSANIAGHVTIEDLYRRRKLGTQKCTALCKSGERATELCGCEHRRIAPQRF
jgi:UDP-N-acetylglucosamine acyltransferase